MASASASASARPTAWPGVSPPLTVDTDTDHSGLLVVFTSANVFLVLASLGFRVYAWHIRKKFQIEDISFVLMVIVACTQLSVVLSEISLGWGKTKALIPSSSYLRMEKVGYAADILYVLVLGLSRITVVPFYNDIFHGNFRWMLQGLLWFSAAGTIASVFVLAIRCSDTPWTNISNAQCSSMLPRWTVMTVLDILGEVVALIYPIQVLRKLKLSTHKKLLLLAIFDSRILLIPMSILHLHYISQQLNSADPTLTGTYATLTAGVHLTVSVLVLISSSLKPFMAVYEDGDGFAYSEEYSNSRSRSKSGAQLSRSQPQNSRLSRPTLGDTANSMSGAGVGATMGYKASARGGWERIEDPILRPSSSLHSREETFKGNNKNAIVVEQEFELSELRPTSFEEVPSKDKR